MSSLSKLQNACVASCQWQWDPKMILYVFRRLRLSRFYSHHPLPRSPALLNMNYFQKGLGSAKQSWNVTLTSTLSIPPDHCRISICIIICSAVKRKLTPKLYGSTNCNNQCFIVYSLLKNYLNIHSRVYLSLSL